MMNLKDIIQFKIVFLIMVIIIIPLSGIYAQVNTEEGMKIIYEPYVKIKADLRTEMNGVKPIDSNDNIPEEENPGKYIACNNDYELDQTYKKADWEWGSDQKVKERFTQEDEFCEVHMNLFPLDQAGNSINVKITKGILKLERENFNIRVWWKDDMNNQYKRVLYTDKTEFWNLEIVDPEKKEWHSRNFYDYIKEKLYVEGMKDGNCKLTLSYYKDFDIFKNDGEPEHSNSIMFNIISGLEIIEMDFKDSIDENGTAIDNNFDIVDSSGIYIVPGQGPEWTSISGMIGETVYVRSSRVTVDLKIKGPSQIANKKLYTEICSEGDLDFTPHGYNDHDLTLLFNSSGIATYTFTTFQKKVTDILLLKEYNIRWKGSCALHTSVNQEIYSVYGKPVDYFNDYINNPSNINDPEYTHLQYLLGPKNLLGTDTGEWCKGKSTLEESSNNSISYAVQRGIIKDGVFNTDSEGESCGNPWNVVTTEAGGVCEDYANLMYHALLVLGVPYTKLDRKSVVSYVIDRPTWFGGGPKKLIKAFREEAGGIIWINEGVCGVETDDNGWRYYDLAGPRAIGKGGWKTPNDSSENNLWYEPTPPDNGPIIFEIVEEYYGTWIPQTDPPYEVTSIKNEYPILIKIDMNTVGINNDDYTIYYRTEGVMNVGIAVAMQLWKADNGIWIQTPQIEIQAIGKKWDNSQSITFHISENGFYTVTAWIIDVGGELPYEYESIWSTNYGPQFLREM